MSKTVLIVGTRKGCFLLESDAERRRWELRGPFCESWPIYHAIHDAETDAIYAAGASEWHGASVWRSPDRGETWHQSSEGLTYGDGPLKLSKVSGLTAANGRVFAGAEMPGVFESRDGGATWSLLSTIDGQKKFVQCWTNVNRACGATWCGSGPPRSTSPPAVTRTGQERSRDAADRLEESLSDIDAMAAAVREIADMSSEINRVTARSSPHELVGVSRAPCGHQPQLGFGHRRLLRAADRCVVTVVRVRFPGGWVGRTACPILRRPPRRW